MSASFPGAPLVANPLLRSVGVLVDNQTLAVFPDDPALGEFRDKWKGVLGLLEERPAPAAESESGPRKVLSPSALFKRIDKSPDHRVDARAFLRARLMDMFLGDRDRHRDQFRWAAFGGKQSLGREIERVVPGDALELTRALGPLAPQRMHQAVGMMHPLGVAGDLPANDAGRVAVVASPVHAADLAVGQQLHVEGAGRRAIMWTCGMPDRDLGVHVHGAEGSCQTASSAR